MSLKTACSILCVKSFSRSFAVLIDNCLTYFKSIQFKSYDYIQWHILAFPQELLCQTQSCKKIICVGSSVVYICLVLTVWLALESNGQ